jgi:hypothetical protein
MNFDRLRETKGVIKAHKKAPVSGLFYVYLVFGAEGGNQIMKIALFKANI